MRVIIEQWLSLILMNDLQHLGNNQTVVTGVVLSRFPASNVGEGVTKNGRTIIQKAVIDP